MESLCACAVKAAVYGQARYAMHSPRGEWCTQELWDVAAL